MSTRLGSTMLALLLYLQGLLYVAAVATVLTEKALIPHHGAEVFRRPPNDRENFAAASSSCGPHFQASCGSSVGRAPDSGRLSERQGQLGRRPPSYPMLRRPKPSKCMMFSRPSDPLSGATTLDQSRREPLGTLSDLFTASAAVTIAARATITNPSSGDHQSKVACRDKQLAQVELVGRY